MAIPFYRLPILGLPFVLEPGIDGAPPSDRDPLGNIAAASFLVQILDCCRVGRVLQQCVALFRSHLANEFQEARIRVI